MFCKVDVKEEFNHERKKKDKGTIYTEKKTKAFC